MEPNVALNVKIEIMPYGATRLQQTMQLAAATPEKEPEEFTLLGATTIADHIVTSPPARIIKT